MTQSDPRDWFASLKHGGLLITPSRLEDFFPETPRPLSSHVEEKLRRALTRFESHNGDGVPLVLDTVLEDVIGLGRRFHPESGSWLKGNAVPTEWTKLAVTGEPVKPRRVWQGQNGASLPVFVDTERRVGIGRGRRAPARVVEWLRRADHRIALLTNAQQWRILYAGLDHDAYAEADTSLFFEEGAPGPQITALRTLLSPGALAPAKEKATPRLLEAIEASRKGQSELARDLGERVRQAVELLIQSHAAAWNVDEVDVTARDLYQAAARVVMRMVVVLFAEARTLLPLDDPIYHDSYGIQGLRESLDRIGGAAGAERLRHRFGAWARLLGLFRLVDEGSPHESLPILRYGGGLFEPGSTDAADPVRRALTIFENPQSGPSDATVHRMLTLLTKSKVKVRQGRGATYVTAPVDFSDLSSEYIGILYEGLLNYELRRVDEEDPIVFLALGDEPALPLSRLEAMDDKAVASLVEKAKKGAKLASPDEEESDEDEDEDSQETEGAEEDEGHEDGNAATEEDDAEAVDDSRQIAADRAQLWARRAVVAGKLVGKPRSKKKDALRQHELEVERIATTLIRRTVLPGEWFLVRFGGTRKGTGTFYTKPQLAVPTAHRTLRPLAYDPPKDSEGKPNEDAPSAEWTPKRPEEILALKVCDPASGSGSFLVASLRFLTAALVASLHYHKLLEARGENTVVTLPKGVPGSALSDDPIPCRLDDAEFDAKLTARLKRYVVELCIYGVDIDPLAVELCRLALWIETMVRDLPFSFLDHKIKCGNSLVGCWFDRFRDYPALAFQRKGGDEKHTKGVHFKKDAWTKAITAFRTHLKRPLGKWVAGDRYLYQQVEGKLPEEIHDEALARFEEMHALPIQETQERADYYREQIQGSQALVRLKEAFDTWCALWFWPADELSCAPMPPELGEPTEEARRIVHELAREYRFFHWELEFPDVFAAEGAGFDAVVGNPPWEIQKPNSKEFFSNIDPLYRSYGKQDALDKQEAYFQSSRDIERRWLLYNARFKALSSWNKHVGSPFGGAESGGGKFSFGKASDDAHRLWRHRRQNYKGYTDPKHPFLWQGSADTNTYKMFLEVGHALARTAGHIGLLVPSGVYTDKGSTDLRRLFLTKCRWQWLFGFENREKIFDIDSRFKFCPVIVEKGGTTDAIKTAFMHRDLKDWEEAEKHVIPYRREQLERFSPNLFTLVEIRTRDDERFVSQMYSDGILMGAWVTAELKTDVLTELHKTNDSAYLVKSSDVEKLRRHAPVADFRDPRAQLWLRAEGFFSVWEGKNVHMFDNSWSEPQLVITLDDVEAWFSKRGRRRPELTIEAFARPRFVFREIAAPTNERSCIATWLPPQSITTYTLRALDVRDTCPWWWLAVFNSFVFDLAARLRGNLHLSTCYDLLSLPRVGDKTEILGQIETRVQQLLGPFLGPSLVSSNAWAIDVDWRSILRAEVEAMVAALYDLTVEDVTHVLRYDSSDPVGFWRVDANVAPPNRMPTLALEAFRTLSEQGLDRFSSVFRSRIATHTSPSASIAWQPDIGWQRAWEEALEAHPDARLSSKSYGTVADIELPIAAERGERYGVKCDNGVGNSQRSLFEDLEEG